MRFQPRIKLRALMILIAIAGLALGLHQRSRRLDRLSLFYSTQANKSENTLIGPDGTGRTAPQTDEQLDAILDHVHWNDSVAFEYRRAVTRPWFPFDPDPRSIVCVCGYHLTHKPHTLH